MVEASHSVPCVHREQLLGLPVPTDASKREQLHWGLGFLTCIFVEVSDLNKLWLKTTHVILMDFLEVLVAGEWNSENRISLLLWRCRLSSLGFLLASGSVAACEEEYSVCMGIGVQKRWKWLLWWVLPYSPLLLQQVGLQGNWPKFKCQKYLFSCFLKCSARCWSELGAHLTGAERDRSPDAAW